MICLDKKEELRQRMAISLLKNIIRTNLPSFTLIRIYGNAEIEFAYYAKKVAEFWQLQKTEILDEKTIPIGNNDEDYYTWILSEIPTISDFDEWLVTSRDSYGYWAEVKSGNRLDTIKELWHKDKKMGGQRLGYSKGFFAINKSINMIIQVGCFLGGRDKGYSSENYYTLTILRI